MTDVSVVIRTKNAEARIGKCLTSLFRQTGTDYDVIVVYGTSTDRTLQIVQTYPVRIIPDEPNTNPCNTGVRESRGRIVAFIDDDCIAPPEWLTFIINDFEDEKVGAVGGPEVAPPTSNYLQRCQEAIRRMENRFFKRGPVQLIATCNAAYRRSALIDAGGFNDYLRYGEEDDLQWRLSQKGWKMLFDRRITVFHDRRPSVAQFYSQQLSNGVGVARKIRLNPHLAKPTVVLIIFLLLVPAALIGLLLTGRLDAALWLTGLLLFLGIVWSSYAAQAVKELKLIPGIFIDSAIFGFARGLGFLIGFLGHFPHQQPSGQAVLRGKDWQKN